MSRWVGLLVLGVGACQGEEAADTGTSSSIPLEEWPQEWVDQEQEVLRLVNIQRTIGAVCGDRPMGGGAPLLEMDEVLRGTARAHSRDMAKRGFFDHVNPGGKDPFDRIAAAGFTGAEPWGENIAGGQPTAASVVDDWMHSPGHCENIMEPQFRVLGVGLYVEQGTELVLYWTQNFAGSH